LGLRESSLGHLCLHRAHAPTSRRRTRWGWADTAASRCCRTSVVNDVPWGTPDGRFFIVHTVRDGVVVRMPDYPAADLVAERGRLPYRA
jgi:phage terminase large subunit-like protein